MSEKQKVTFNLGLPGQLALEQLMDETGETQTLIMNNALVAYAYLRSKMREGTLKITRPGGSDTEIVFL